MKKLLLFLIFSAFFFWASAQYWNLTGNVGTTNSNFLGTADCMPLIFKTNNTERMWLSSDGSFLGIGTSNTTSTLHLHYQMDIRSCNFLPLPKTLKLMRLTTPGNERGGFGIISDGKDIRFRQYEQANFILDGLEGGLTITPDGNIGVGTSDPQAKLDVDGSFMALKATIIDTLTTNVLKSQNANISGTLSTNNMSINGKLGFGTNLPQQKLHIVDGNILLTKNTFKTAPPSPLGAILFGVEMNYFPNGSWGIEYFSDESGLNFFRPYNPGGGAFFNYALFLHNSGKVGIGKKNPETTLDVNGSFKATSATVTGNTYLNGNVGIGTNIPKQKLHIVDGNILISKTSSKDMAAPLSPNGSIFFGADINDQFPSGKWGIEYLNGEDGVYGLNFWRPWNPGGGGYFNYGLFLTDDGKMGVGKKDPQTKLDVNGSFKAASANITGALSATSATINGALSATSASIAGILKTKEVQVTLAGWPDYVFDKDYKLPTLSEVEQFIAENNHLPNVPSAAEVEANGIQLGEMNAILIQKVEELTLYILEQNRKMLDLQNQINELKNSKP